MRWFILTFDIIFVIVIFYIVSVFIGCTAEDDRAPEVVNETPVALANGDTITGSDTLGHPSSIFIISF